MVTLLDLKTDIIEDLDLLNSNFVTVPEIERHIRSAVKIASTNVHNLYEDYYLANTTINIISGTSEYNLPSDIYADKIRRIIYNENDKKYQIPRIININDIYCIEDSDDLYYMLINNLATGKKIKFYPTPNVSTNPVIYYIREAKELLVDSDVLDLPEFEDFVKADAKLRILLKEPSNPALPAIQQDRNEQMLLMIQTLSKRQPDNINDMRGDYSFYDDSIA